VSSALNASRDAPDFDAAVELNVDSGRRGSNACAARIDSPELTSVLCSEGIEVGSGQPALPQWRDDDDFAAIQRNDLCLC
jgi:hypothetical protein